MSWKISGSYFETCSCALVCPCTASLSLGATNDYCRVVLVFHVKQGDVEGVDVSRGGSHARRRRQGCNAEHESDISFEHALLNSEFRILNS